MLFYCLSGCEAVLIEDTIDNTVTLNDKHTANAIADTSSWKENKFLNVDVKINGIEVKGTEYKEVLVSKLGKL